MKNIAGLSLFMKRYSMPKSGDVFYRKDIAMIDLITIAATQGYRHTCRPGRGKTDEDRFYAEFGDSGLVNFAAWLTSLDLSLRRRRKAAAQSSGGCAPQATFLAPR